MGEFVGSGSGVQVFARDVRDPDDAGLVYLPDGGADELRERTRAHLVCPLPGCPSPNFTTRGGRRRHHFVHLTSVEAHSYESLAHHTAKHLLARTVAHRHPGLTLNVDDRKVETGQLPDVLVTSPRGARVALEVQYSPISVGAWLTRHHRFERGGITEQWIWGHRPPNLRRTRTGTVQLTGAHAGAAAAGIPLMWINPFTEQVAWWVPDLFSAEAIEGSSDASWLADHDVIVQLEPVSELRFVGQQLVTESHAAALGNLNAQLAERRAKTERAAEAKRRRQEWGRQRQAEREGEWEAYRQQAWPRRIPKLIESHSADQYGLYLTPPHWRSIVYRELVAGKVGASFHPRTEVERLFSGRFREREAAIRSVHAFLFKLKKGGSSPSTTMVFSCEARCWSYVTSPPPGRKLDVQRDPANTLTYVVASSGEVVGRLLDPRFSALRDGVV